jgi:DNA-directed RNA polymerase specialized sigma24 family protein
MPNEPPWSPTPESLEKLLTWLSSNPENGAERYEKVRQRLIKYFACNGGGDDAEDLADKTLDRVMKRLERGEIPEPFTGDKTLYFLAFARNIRMEHYNSRKREPPRRVIDPDRMQAEAEDACLQECARILRREDRWLAIEYYRFDKTTKVAHHSNLADRFELTKAGLRTRIHRIREQLRPCIKECLERRTE